jgi:putative ABC transport system permease protein
MRVDVRWLAPFCLIVAAVSCARPDDGPIPPRDSYTSTRATMAVDGRPEDVTIGRVTSSFFGDSRLQPMFGRRFMPEDYTSPARVVLMHHDFWQARFESSPEIVGTTIQLDGVPLVIVGVMPRGFDVPDGAQLWVPVTGGGG